MKVLNTSGRRYDIHSIPTRIEEGGKPIGSLVFSVPPAESGELGTINGECEIPDEILDELLAKDKWTQAVFASGHLVKASE